MRNFYDTIESLLCSFIIITLLILFAFRAVSVDGNSMNPTLKDKERVITTNFLYTPKKGDIVVIDKNNHLGKPLVKRVIATEGDTIRIDYSTGDVYVNNALLQENYILEKIKKSTNDNLEITVEKGYIFVMGDNRNNSTDSRSELVGQVNTKSLLGKALFRIFPVNKIGVVK